MARVVSPFTKPSMIRTLLISRSLPSVYTTSFAKKEGITCSCLQVKPLLPFRSIFMENRKKPIRAQHGVRETWELDIPVDTRYAIHTVKAKGFPNNVTLKDVADFFHDSNIAEHGIHISRRGDGHTSGTAFVEFATRRDKTLARKKDGEKLRKRYIEVDATTTKERLWFYRHRERDELATSTTRKAAHVIKIKGLKRWKNEYKDGKSNAEGNETDNQSSEIQSSETNQPKPNLRNQSSEIFEEDIRTFFNNADIPILGVTLTTDQHGNSIGEAYVGLDSEEAVSRSKLALEASGDGNLINNKRNRILDSSPEKVRTWDPIYFAWKYKKGTSAGKKSNAKDVGAKKGDAKKGDAKKK